MATSTDYGLAVYNGQGVNVLAKNLFCPKLIGSMTLRLRDLNQPGQLSVVAADGSELPLNDGCRNRPLKKLMERGLTQGGEIHSAGMLRTRGGMIRTACTVRFEFSLYGGERDSEPLLPAVIHGWGSGYDADKWEKARRLVHSVLSGQDWQLAKLLNKLRYGGGTAADYPKYRLDWTRSQGLGQGLFTGLPVTMTFRSRALGATDSPQTELDGFGLVSCCGGRLYVEMSSNTEITVHFYELAGIPWEYFAQCSTVAEPTSYGLVVYRYEPAPMKFVMTVGDTGDMFGMAQQPSPFEMGYIDRGSYVFATDTPLPLDELAQRIGQENTAVKRQMSQLFEGDPDKPLRYEVLNNARPYLRLLSNTAAIRKGQAITVRNDTRPNQGAIYTVKGGHDYSKVCNMLVHGAAGLFKLPGGGLLNAVGGTMAHSAFERSMSNRPLYVHGPNVPDDYKGAPWNPTVPLRMSDVYKRANLDYYAPQHKPSWDELMGNPSVLDKFNNFLTNSTWSLQRAFNLLFKLNPVVAYEENANYSPEEAAKRRRDLRVLQNRYNEAEAQREFETWGGWDVEAQKEIQAAAAAQKGLLDLIDLILNSTEENRSDQVPFWGGQGFRHSDDKLEVYKYISLKSDGKAYQPPEYVPENWILCRLPV
ncbi:hypothetical protein [Eikenella exigua]|uniref:Virion structural protein n=1 Tax=Eikenella exigua TaxID=2528037 RepID=A0AAX1F9T8_9NEIS|nr:hypothetical protein [Eikenella exigua]QED92842.1 hypothetical protein EZJ17_09670 [Eikenella exigua]